MGKNDEENSFLLNADKKSSFVVGKLKIIFITLLVVFDFAPYLAFGQFLVP